jgi:putative transposase
VAYSLHAHLVFVTRYRRGVFDDAMLKQCEEIMREVCDSFEIELREFNGGCDHVHLLVHYPAKVAISKLVNSLKGVSSRYLRAEYTGRINRIARGSVFWSRSSFAGSCGGAPLAVIRQYVESQQRPT